MIKEKKNFNGVLIGIIAVLILVVIILLYLVFYQNNQLMNDGSQNEIIEENNAISSISVEEELDDVVDGLVTGEAENGEVKVEYGFTVEKSNDDSTYIAILYLNPTDSSKKCDFDIMKSEGMNYNDISDRQCLKFYVYAKSQDGKSYDAILDQNIVDHSLWSTTNNVYDGPVQALKALKMATENWTSVNKQTGKYGMHVKVDDMYLINYDIYYETYDYYARLITASEIAQIVDKSDQLNVMHKTGKSIKFDDSIVDGLSEFGQNKYGWLFGNTYNCFQYGCNALNYNSNGFWTASASSYVATQMSGAFPIAVDYSGALVLKVGPGSDYYGVRPVISIPSSWID